MPANHGPFPGSSTPTSGRNGLPLRPYPPESQDIVKRFTRAKRAVLLSALGRKSGDVSLRGLRQVPVGR